MAKVGSFDEDRQHRDIGGELRAVSGGCSVAMLFWLTQPNGPEDLTGLYAQNSAKDRVFVNIQSSLHPLDSTDKRLVLPIRVSEIPLTHSQSLPTADQAFDDFYVLGAEQ